MSAPDLPPGLVEAVAEAVLTAYLPVRERFTPWKAASAVSDEQRQTARTYAHAAIAAMVEHLGLVEERSGYCYNSDLTHTRCWTSSRRLVSRWTEVDHGSE